jgi:enoyl-CoA hydratase/carnithine racemase
VRQKITIIEQGPVVELALASPILSIDMLEQLSVALDHLSASNQRSPIVISSSHPRIFLAGADLAEIARLSWGTSDGYARLGRSVLDRISRVPAPVVAAVNGTCAGGGFDLVLACDLIVASTTARFGHPGVERGLVTGWGGTSALPEAAGPVIASRAMLAATWLTPEELEVAGTVRAVVGNPRSHALARAALMASIDPRRIELWRALKGRRFVDSFRAFVVHKL